MKEVRKKARKRKTPSSCEFEKRGFTKIAENHNYQTESKLLFFGLGSRLFSGLLLDDLLCC
jgi:hypothetical protein